MTVLHVCRVGVWYRCCYCCWNDQGDNGEIKVFVCAYVLVITAVVTATGVTAMAISCCWCGWWLLLLLLLLLSVWWSMIVVVVLLLRLLLMSSLVLLLLLYKFSQSVFEHSPETEHKEPWNPRYERTHRSGSCNDCRKNKTHASVRLTF